MSYELKDVEKEMLALWDLFQVQLPKLIESELRDRWVIFAEGKVVSAHGDEEEAFVKAIDTYGPDSPFIVAKVANENPALVLFNRR